MSITKTDSYKIRPLRHLVLRAGKPYSTTSYDKDCEKETFHLAKINNDIVLCCATFYPETTNKIASKKAFRLRGMATHPNYRRNGIAKELMKEAIKKLKAKQCDLIWCNARLNALEFYKSIGFKIKGKIFNIEDIGPHYWMFRVLKH